MSTSTSIEWTDRTWNPVRGCSRVSAGCDNCYAMNMAHRFSGAGKPFEGLTTIRRGKVDWAGVARFIPEQLGAPLKWRKPSRIFVNSMSDLFHPSLSNEEIAAVFGVMAACPQHTFQVLTKQPKRADTWFKWLANDLRNSERNAIAEASPPCGVACGIYAANYGADVDYLGLPDVWPLPNVWLGVSAENQKMADQRIPLLLTLPAAVRFVSAEPLLGAMDLRPFTSWLAGVQRGDSYATVAAAGSRLNAARVGEAMRGFCAVLGSDNMLSAPDDALLTELGHLDWVIVGGESGNGARPCALEWIEGIVEQCKTAGVACFVKQLGAVVVSEQRACETDEEAKRDFGAQSRWLWSAGLSDRKGGDITEWPNGLQVRQFPEAGGV